MPLTTEELAAFEAAERGLTPGPWRVEEVDVDLVGPDDSVHYADGNKGNILGYLYTEQDTTSIIALRNSLPQLLHTLHLAQREVTELQAVIKAVRASCGEWAKSTEPILRAAGAVIDSAINDTPLC